MTMKVYTGMSGRRATTDIRECEEKGLMAKAPSYNSVFRYIERADLAPLLKTLVHEAAVRRRDGVRDRQHGLRHEHLRALVRREVRRREEVPALDQAPRPGRHAHPRDRVRRGDREQRG